MTKKQKSVAVFCGSRLGLDPVYLRATQSLGTLLAKKKITLVYGAGSTGLMGALADACLQGGGEVIGAIPQFLVEKEKAHPGLSQLYTVTTMHDRKAKMAELADAFIALPGGFGTLDELFEIITWAQLDLHQKPIGVLNVNGFFDPLKTMIETASQKGYIGESNLDLIVWSENSEELLQKLTLVR